MQPLGNDGVEEQACASDFVFFCDVCKVLCNLSLLFRRAGRRLHLHWEQEQEQGQERARLQA